MTSKQNYQPDPDPAVEALKHCAYKVHERGGRFGEDILSVRCKLCNELSTEPNDLRHKPECVLFGKGGLPDD
jgi:sporulation-control protein spo0M